MNLEASLHSLLSFAWILTRPINFNFLRQNIVFSYSERIPVSCSWLFHYFSVFLLLLFYVIINFYKKYFIIFILLLLFFSWKLFLCFHVPECSGMFRNVPYSWFYRRPVWTAGRASSGKWFTARFFATKNCTTSRLKVWTSFLYPFAMCLLDFWSPINELSLIFGRLKWCTSTWWKQHGGPKQ